jgi:hypothetical protein
VPSRLISNLCAVPDRFLPPSLEGESRTRLSPGIDLPTSTRFSSTYRLELSFDTARRRRTTVHLATSSLYVNSITTASRSRTHAPVVETTRKPWLKPKSGRNHSWFVFLLIFLLHLSTDCTIGPIQNMILRFYTHFLRLGRMLVVENLFPQPGTLLTTHLSIQFRRKLHAVYHPTPTSSHSREPNLVRRHSTGTLMTSYLGRAGWLWRVASRSSRLVLSSF